MTEAGAAERLWIFVCPDRASVRCSADMLPCSADSATNCSRIPSCEGCFVCWCPGWELNPHSRCREKDFKSFASADFATRALLVRASFMIANASAVYLSRGAYERRRARRAGGKHLDQVRRDNLYRFTPRRERGWQHPQDGPAPRS